MKCGLTGMVTTPPLHVLLKCGIFIRVIPVALIAEARVRRVWHSVRH